MSGTFGVGSVLLFHNYVFDDGTSKAKFLVLLGKQDNGNCLLVLTTSQRHYKVDKPGCTQHPRTYYLIEGDRKNFFNKDTWLLLYDPKILTTAELINLGMKREIDIKHQIIQNKIGHIRNCFKNSDDVSKLHLEICGF